MIVYRKTLIIYHSKNSKMVSDIDLEIIEGVLPYVILRSLSQKQYRMSILLSRVLMQVEGLIL